MEHKVSQNGGQAPGFKVTQDRQPWGSSNVPAQTDQRSHKTISWTVKDSRQHTEKHLNNMEKKSSESNSSSRSEAPTSNSRSSGRSIKLRRRSPTRSPESWASEQTEEEKAPEGAKEIIFSINKYKLIIHLVSANSEDYAINLLHTNINKNKKKER